MTGKKFACKVTIGLTPIELMLFTKAAGHSGLTRSAFIRIVVRTYLARPGHGFVINYHGAVLWSHGEPDEVAEVGLDISTWC